MWVTSDKQESVLLSTVAPIDLDLCYLVPKCKHCCFCSSTLTCDNIIQGRIEVQLTRIFVEDLEKFWLKF